MESHIIENEFFVFWHSALKLCEWYTVEVALDCLRSDDTFLSQASWTFDATKHFRVFKRVFLSLQPLRWVSLM
jgi:hypothetical protein